MASGTTELLMGVWGASPRDVFAVGMSAPSFTTMARPGGRWSPARRSPSPPSGAGTGRDVFAAGGGGTILHYDGATFSAMESGTAAMLFRAWGRAGDDVYVTGEQGILLHYDGSSWRRAADRHDGASLHRVGRGGPRSSLVGGGGTILHR